MAKGAPEGCILDPETVSFDSMMQVYLNSKEYLKASKWHMEDGTFAPNKAGITYGRGPLRRLRGLLTKTASLAVRTVTFTMKAPFHVVLWAPRRVLRRLRHLRRGDAATDSEAVHEHEPAPEPAQPAQHKEPPPKRLVDVQRSMIHVPRSRACGSDKVRELHHISSVMPGVEPVYLVELTTSAAYGVGWNPSIRKVVARQHRHVRRDTVLPEVFNKDALKAKLGTAPNKLLLGSSDKIDAVAQVTEMPIPLVLQRVSGGPRYTADFIGARYDCKARRGFTLATSFGTEAVAEAAGVEKGQELCLSAMMIAPYEGPGWNGTKLHIVTHFDPQVPSGVRKIVHSSVGRSLKGMMAALHRRALQAQSTGKHPYIDCP